LAPSGERRSINPCGDFLERQKDLALRTLYCEVAEYKPDLVVMVTKGDRAFDFAMELLQGWGQRRQESSRGHPFEYLEFATAHPTVLLVEHPERKPCTVRDQWVTKSAELLGHTRDIPMG
jgi:hypothetical protein